MKFLRNFLIFSLNLGVLSSLASAQTTADDDNPIRPPWQVCNETSYVLRFATAMIPEGDKGTALQVSGWQRLIPGACETVRAEKGTPRFVYAQSAKHHQGGVREWKGKHDYCVATEDFTAKTDLSCALQNLEAKQFLRIIPTEERTAFVEPDNFGQKAVTAGLQRLLLDNNYEISRIDGITGRRTSKTLEKFLTDNKLSRDLDAEAQFNALIAGAIDTQKNTGLRVCNNSTRKVWTALAFTRDGYLESRGWWPLDVAQCERLYNASLKTSPLHFYARQESSTDANEGAQDFILKVSANSAKELCIGEAQFSAVRQEYCKDQGYIPANFHMLPTDSLGREINLTDASFASPVASGLR